MANGVVEMRDTSIGLLDSAEEVPAGSCHRTSAVSHAVKSPVSWKMRLGKARERMGKVVGLMCFVEPRCNRVEVGRKVSVSRFRMP